MNKRIKDMTEKDIKEYLQSDRGRAAMRWGSDLGMRSIMKSLKLREKEIS